MRFWYRRNHLHERIDELEEKLESLERFIEEHGPPRFDRPTGFIR